MKMTAGVFFVLAIIFVFLAGGAAFMGMSLPVSDNDRAPKDIRQAALHVLNPQFHASSVAVEIGSISQDGVDRELALIKKYKAWADTQDRDVRRAYYYWLDHFEGQAHSAQRAINNGARERWEASRKKDMEEYARTSTIARSIPQPR